MVTPAPIVAVVVPAAVLTLLPRPSDTVMPDTCVPAVASSATFTTVPSLNFVTGPHTGDPMLPAATLNAGPPFSVKLKESPTRLGAGVCLQTFKPRAGFASFVYVTKVSVAAVEPAFTVTVTVPCVMSLETRWLALMAFTCRPAVGASTIVCEPAATDIGPEQPPPATAIPAPPSTENENDFPAIPFAADLQISNVPGAETRGRTAAFATVAGTTRNPLNNNVISEDKSQNSDFRPRSPCRTMPPM